MTRTFKEKLLMIRKFISSDVWDIELSSLSTLRRQGVKAVRIIHLVLKGFHEDECPLHASALTFNTLMAIVPIFALSLALARVFGGAEIAESRLRGAVADFTSQFETRQMVTGQNDPGEQAVANTVLNGSDMEVLQPEELAVKLNEMLDAGFKHVSQINFTALGSLGLILLIWMVVAVLTRVESSFNRVWGVSIGRPMFRRFSDYLFMVIVLPFLITIASSLSIVEFVARFLDAENTARLGAIMNSATLRNLTTLLLTGATFTVLLKFMPNTKVRFRPALAGGIIAALLFVAWLWICATIQVGVAKYSKLYGGFAIMPIVFAWVYVSWEIILFGAEVAFAVQNCTTYRMEQGANKANVHAKVVLALSVVAECARAMIGERDNFEVAVYAREKRIPIRFLNDIVEELTRAGVLGRLSDKDNRYVLLKTPATLTIHEVYNVIMRTGVAAGDLGLASVEHDVLAAVDDVTSGKTIIGKRSIKELLESRGQS
ncbi:MAG: YihY/virulence factor BrkB family protein [Lentisphaerae bacterium]|nr:YihY/virulence factor BrkB family protein [Lentisphaerota bacterium]